MSPTYHPQVVDRDTTGSNPARKLLIGIPLARPYRSDDRSRDTTRKLLMNVDVALYILSGARIEPAE